MAHNESPPEFPSDQMAEYLRLVARGFKGQQIEHVGAAASVAEVDTSVAGPGSAIPVAETADASAENVDSESVPQETMPSEEDAAPRRRWAPGQIRIALRYLHSELGKENNRRVDMYALLPSRQAEIARWHVETDLSLTEIAEQMGIGESTASKRVHFALDNIMQRADPKDLPAQLPKPEGRIIEDNPEATVGRILNGIREELGIELKELAEVLDVSISSLSLFFNSRRYSNTTKILKPVMAQLGIPPRQFEQYLKLYKIEQEAYLTKLKKERDDAE